MSVSLIRTPFQLFYLNNPITGLKQYSETFYLLNAGLEKIWYLFVSSTRIPALLKSYILSFLWLIGIKKVIEVQIVFLIFTCGTKVLKQVVNLSCFLWNTGLKMPPNPHPPPQILPNFCWKKFFFPQGCFIQKIDNIFFLFVQH